MAEPWTDPEGMVPCEVGEPFRASYWPKGVYVRQVGVQAVNVRALGTDLILVKEEPVYRPCREDGTWLDDGERVGER